MSSLDADRYRCLRINAGVSSYAPFMNSDTDAADATDGACVSIRSIRNGSVNASAESGTVRIVSARSEESATEF